MIPKELQKAMKLGHTKVLYKYIISHIDDIPQIDVNSIIRLGFKARPGMGRTTPERALKLCRAYPGRVDPNMVKDVILQTYDLGILCGFMLDHPNLVTTEDLRVCVKHMGDIHNYEEHVKEHIKKIETAHPQLKGTPIWNSLITADTIGG